MAVSALPSSTEENCCNKSATSSSASSDPDEKSLSAGDIFALNHEGGIWRGAISCCLNGRRGAGQDDEKRIRTLQVMARSK